jgi:mycothiol synthase
LRRLGAAAAIPSGRRLSLSPWDQAEPARFYAVYRAAFRDRPGFPGWPQARWVRWLSEDGDFRPEWTLLATMGGADVGFIAGEATGRIMQMGPAARPALPSTST